MKQKRHRWRNTVVTLAVLVPIVAAVVYSSFHVSDFECEVCIAFEGREACRTVKAKTETEALRGAISNTCALISSGVTDTLRCERTPPGKATCRRLAG